MPELPNRWMSSVRLFLWALVGAGAAFLLVHLPLPKGVTPPSGVAVGGFSGDFTLVDEKGATVTPQAYGRAYKLVFFGFTHCPAVCPTELLKMADILASLPPQVSKRLVPLFITVDPERDTPAVLRAYTDNFDSRIVGLTGRRAQVDAAIAGFKVYAARVDTGHGDYTMDHSTFMYLLGPDQTLIKLFRMEDTAPEIVAAIKALIE